MKRQIKFKCKIGKRNNICDKKCPLYIGRIYGGVVGVCAIKHRDNKSGLDIKHGEAVIIIVGGAK